MNTPRPPSEPLDAQERELARILRALPAGEPPPALDAAILRAATNAAAGSRRPGARILASAGALWGIGSAAAAVLALGVAWQMRYGTPDRAPAAESAPRAQAVSDQAEDDTVQVELGERRKDAPAIMPPPAVEQSAPAATMASAPARAPAVARQAPAAPPPPAPAAAAPEPFALDALDEHVAARAASNAVDAREAKTEASAMAKERATTGAARDLDAAKSTAQAAPVAAEAQSRADAGSASALGGLAAAPQKQAPMKPASWLAEIRRLRDEGKIAQARAKLVEFRREYPNWVIPTDLAPLLSE